jgi:hypothetical protein
LAEKRSFPAPVARWLGVRDAIYHQMHTEFWNEELQGFVQTKNGKTLDAACLLAPLVRFISPTDPRWLSTLRAIGGRASGRLTGLSIQDRRWPDLERRNLLHAFLLAGVVSEPVHIFQTRRAGIYPGHINPHDNLCLSSHAIHFRRSHYLPRRRNRPLLPVR